MSPRGAHTGGLGAERDGVALLLALVFIALLSAFVVDYCYEMEVEASLATTRQAEFEAYLAAKSAVASGMALLAADLVDVEEFNGADFDSYIDLWAEGVPMDMINEAGMRCSIADEQGKINLNALIYMDADGNTHENVLLIEALRLLFDLREVEENPADAILDWLDPDDDELEMGGEMGYYTALEIPYPCKNGRMDSIEELLMIRGITPELYFGLPEEGAPPLMEDEEPPLPLPELLTVHGDPMGRINVNTAPPQVLDAVFEVWDRASIDQVDMILERTLNMDPYQHMDELVAMFGRPDDPNEQPRQPQRPDEDAQPEPPMSEFDRPPEEVVSVGSRVFRVYGDGMKDNVRVRIAAYVWRNPGPGAELRQEAPPEAMESFRVLDWRVIR